MKRRVLSSVEIRTLRDMGIFHSHPRTRMRAQAIVRLSKGLTQQQVLRDLADQQGGTAGALLRNVRQNGQQPPVSVHTIKRYLKKAEMRYKRCRYSLKRNGTETPLTTPEL
jgi:hypothetical protein